MYVVSMACTYEHNLRVMSKLMQFNFSNTLHRIVMGYTNYLIMCVHFCYVSYNISAQYIYRPKQLYMTTISCCLVMHSIHFNMKCNWCSCHICFLWKLISDKYCLKMCTNVTSVMVECTYYYYHWCSFYKPNKQQI